MRIVQSLSIAALLILASCAGSPRVVPEAAPPIAIPAPMPSPRPAPAPVSSDWRDLPVTPGNWAYRQDERGSIALYGRTGADAELTLRCDRAQGRIYLSRLGAGVTALSVRTTSSLHPLRVIPVGGAIPYVAAELGPRDAAIDAMGFSRGRFVVESAGLATLVVPAWPEILRVAEDCRG